MMALCIVTALTTARLFGDFRHILHDPSVYTDPFTFNPDRFIKDGQLDTSVFNPHAASFGFGRR